jgi:hypothetical protein
MLKFLEEHASSAWSAAVKYVRDMHARPISTEYLFLSPPTGNYHLLAMEADKL